MDSRWNVEGYNQRKQDSPKLMLAGEWEVTVNGHRFSIQFFGQRVVARFSRVADLIWARRLMVPAVFRTVLERYSLTLDLHFGGIAPIRLYPHPSFFTWLLSGQARRLNRK